MPPWVVLFRSRTTVVKRSIAMCRFGFHFGTSVDIEHFYLPLRASGPKGGVFAALFLQFGNVKYEEKRNIHHCLPT